MRILSRSIRQLKSILRKSQGDNYAISLASRRYLSNQRPNFTYEAIQNRRLCRYAHPLWMISRSLSVEAVQVSNGGLILFRNLNIVRIKF